MSLYSKIIFHNKYFVIILYIYNTLNYCLKLVKINKNKYINLMI